MEASRSTSLTAYARGVEELWAEVLSRPVILSARDWSLITDWHARGVPLQVLREAADALLERRRSSPPRGLAAIAEAVSETWQVIEGGRVAVAADPEPHPEAAEDPDPLGSWRACVDQRGDAPELVRLLESLIQRHAAGSPPAELDRELDSALDAVAPEPLRGDAGRDVERALAPFRGRMPAEALRDTRRRAMADRLRQLLGLRRIAKNALNP